MYEKITINNKTFKVEDFIINTHVPPIFVTKEHGILEPLPGGIIFFEITFKTKEALKIYELIRGVEDFTINDLKLQWLTLDAFKNSVKVTGRCL